MCQHSPISREILWTSVKISEWCAVRYCSGRAACTTHSAALCHVHGRAACTTHSAVLRVTSMAELPVRCTMAELPACMMHSAARHVNGRAACIHSCHSCMTSHLLNLPKRSLHLIFCFSSTAWVCVHASDTDYTNLSNVFHDEWTLLDLLHGLDAPATAICRPEYADAMLASVLNNAVRTLWSALALVIALIDGRPRRQTNTTFRVVSKLRACVTSTARWSLLHTVCALTPDHRVLF